MLLCHSSLNINILTRWFIDKRYSLLNSLDVCERSSRVWGNWCFHSASKCASKTREILRDSFLPVYRGAVLLEIGRLIKPSSTARPNWMFSNIFQVLHETAQTEKPSEAISTR